MTLRFGVVLGAIAACACAALAGEPVNTACPISGKTFDEPAATVEVDGHTVGFCCPGCMPAFKAWSAEKKAEFIQTSLTARAGQPDAADADPAEADEADLGDPYPLATCPISGETLGSMGDPVIKAYDDREVRYCCDACQEPFEKDLKASWAKVDRKLIESQTPFYPLSACLQCGKDLDGENVKPVDFVYRNRLFRTCSDACRQAVLAEPAAAWKTLDAAVIQAQRDHYPLETCPVSGEKLGEMGKPAERVIANRLVLLCCDGCDDKLVETAPAILAKLDDAWKKKYGDDRPDITIERVEKKAAAGS